MAAGYKAKTTAAQVAIRDAASTNGTVLMRVTNGSEIEVGTSTVSDSSGNTWRRTACGYQKVGYMMTNFISITDRTSNKYYMIQTLETFGNKTYVSSIVGQINKNESYKILAKSLTNSYYWYRIGTNQWVRGDFFAPSSGGTSGGTGGGSTSYTATICQGDSTDAGDCRVFYYGSKNLTEQ